MAKTQVDAIVEVVFAGPTGTFTLAPGQHYVGRVESCAIPIRSSKISRQHASIDITPRAVVVKDLGSSNGTFVDGERLSAPRALRSGQTVAFADTEFKVEVKSVVA